MMSTERIYKDLRDTGNYIPAVITVRVRNIYGNKTVYPACPKSKIFADIAGHSTLTPATLDGVRRLGYLIEVQQEVVEI